MSCSLSYDSGLSRVRISANSLCTTGIVDTFTRTVTGGWGNATSGQPWTVSGTASEYSVTSGVGRQNNVTEAAFRNAALNVANTNYDYTASVSMDKLAAGAEQIVELAARFTDTSNFYAARATFAVGGAITLDVRKRVAGVQTAFQSSITLLTQAINTMYSIRFRLIGNVLKAKIWLASNAEPLNWMVQGTDVANSLTTGSSIALRSTLVAATSNEPVIFSFDNVHNNAPTYATIDRTLDGFNYTIVRGAAQVGVTTGCELERIVDDFEFPVGQLITYRIRSFVGSDQTVVTTTCTITVNLTEIWLKSIGRPFLNQPLDCVSDGSSITRAARNGINPIVRRSYPIAITDVRGARQQIIRTVTQTTTERQDLDLLLASGDPVYLQTPLNHPIPTMYAVIGDTDESRPVKNRQCNNDWRLFTLPFIEVAAPGPDVIGSLGTWQTVVNTYATWSAVLAAHPTWADLLELIGDGTEVIVP